MSTPPVVIHVPHASIRIQEPFLGSLILTPEEIEDELVTATDAYCDELYEHGLGVMVAARWSRLACDVERFRDDAREPCALKGNGLLYISTLRGKAIRRPDPALREQALAEIYDPHHRALTEAVDEALAGQGRCLIIDGHSFGDDAFLGPNLPDYCIGTDPYHTPRHFYDTARAYLEAQGYSVAENYPFAGAIVPMKHYAQNKNVISVMIEVNRRLYLHKGTMEKSDGFDTARTVCGALMRLFMEASDQHP